MQIIDKEKQLVIAIKQSDGNAFKEICKLYYDQIYRFLWRRTRDNETACDLVQDVFLNVWKNRSNLDENKPIKAYFYRAANNAAINHLHKKVLTHKHFDKDQPVEDPVSNDKDMDFQEYLDDVLYDIPEQQRIVFILNKFEGFKYTEIAETLQISVKTVESRMSKTLKTLRARLGHLLMIVLFIFTFFSNKFMNVHFKLKQDRVFFSDLCR